MNAILDTCPSESLNGLITAQARFKSTSTAGEGVLFCVRAEQDGGYRSVIFSYLLLQPDGTQMLTVKHKTADSSKVALVTVPDLPNDFVTLRLLIDPSRDTVNVRVNGEDEGTYYYDAFVSAGDSTLATLKTVDSAGEFDYARIRVGGNP